VCENEKQITISNKGAERRVREKECECVCVRKRDRDIKRREFPIRQSRGIARIMSRRKQATPRSLRRKYTDIIYYQLLPIYRRP